MLAKTRVGHWGDGLAAMVREMCNSDRKMFMERILMSNCVSRPGEIEVIDLISGRSVLLCNLKVASPSDAKPTDKGPHGVRA